MVWIIGLACLGFLIFQVTQKTKQKSTLKTFPAQWKQLLLQHVAYYRQLSDEHKQAFENRVLAFLQDKKITGVDVEVDDTTRILVAASAIIPAFAFEDYNYPMIREVLLYSSFFDNSFLNPQKGIQNGISGMVGEGPLSQVVMLSKPDLLAGFQSGNRYHNVGIHEFTHLLDKTDGATDGLPENLLDQAHMKSWVNAMHHELMDIRKGESDISPYALTNDAEFFAVASEYFFVSPETFKEKHPELLLYLQKIFRQKLDPEEGLEPQDEN